MGKRREPRKPVQEVTVRILGTDAHEHPFAEKVDALDVSRCGLRVRGLSVALKLEDIISVSHKDQKARYRVKWVAESGTPLQREAGLENIAPEKNIFDFPLPIPILDPYAGPSAGERRTAQRLRCAASAELHPDGQGAPMMASVVDLSLGGCFIEMPMPLRKGTHLTIGLWLNEVKVQANAVVSNVRPGFGMGVEFKDVRPEEQAKLRDYIAKIPRYPFQGKR
jgi:hypothetical protein